jgi:hypothetical protein
MLGVGKPVDGKLNGGLRARRPAERSQTLCGSLGRSESWRVMNRSSAPIASARADQRHHVGGKPPDS